ncbi:glycosyltransferase, partial [Baaleninema sp.]|uniref:glycosyltransferase n=1 Tax=Baaleninema sp. TaxID=3101197 RepID=UPI003D0687C4
DENVIAAIAVSQHNREILEFCYPNLPVFRVYCGIDRHTFQFSQLSQKRKQIAANPNKNVSEILSVYQMLRSRSLQGLNSLPNWDWVWIEDKSEAEVVKILRESAIFVSLSLQEGFGILPLEAMASGCLVVAYGVEPMTEYLPPEMQLPPGELKAVVDRVETWIEKFSGDSRDLQGLCDRSLVISKTYSIQRESESVVSAWNAILKQIPKRKTWF